MQTKLETASSFKNWAFRSADRIPLDNCFLSPKNFATVNAIHDFALAEGELGSGVAHHPQFNNTVVQGDARSLVAALLSVDPTDISIKENTNSGIAQIALGFPFQEGDEVITYRYDYPSVREPFKPLQELKGIRLVDLEGSHDPHGIPTGWSLEELDRKITNRTRLVVVSHVQFISGHTADLQKLSEVCRSRNIRLIVDIAQSVGVLPIDPVALKLDGVIFPCWKGLLASRGVAILWTSPEFRETIKMNIRGSGALQAKNFTDWDAPEFSDGRKFEPSTLPTNLLCGLNASLRTNFFDPGVCAVSEHIKELQRHFLSLIDWDFAIPLFPEASERGLILSFALPNWSGREDEVVLPLAQQGIVVTCRGGALRIAPHYYLNSADIERAAYLINEVLKKG